MQAPLYHRRETFGSMGFNQRRAGEKRKGKRADDQRACPPCQRVQQAADHGKRAELGRDMSPNGIRAVER